jgi:hypothetical protein
VKAAAFALVFAAIGQAVPAPKPIVMDPKGYVALRAGSPLLIDGKLDDAAWRDAPWTDLFVDIEGDAKPKPALDTRVKMLWDDTYFYVGADLREPHLWATLTTHDSVIFRDNDFEVFIDPNGDNHEYYEFEINALGTFWDLFLPKPYRDGGKALDSWEIPGLKSAVAVDGTLNIPSDTDRGWTVELAFPWAVLGQQAHRDAPPHDGDQWRVNFSRVEWPIDIANGAYRKPANATEHNWVWSPQHVVDMHRPSQWGYVQFATATHGPVAFVPDPSLPARRWLQMVYEAERAYRSATGQFAATFGELGITAPADASLRNARLAVAGQIYDASVELRLPGQPPQWWHITQDEKVTLQYPSLMSRHVIQDLPPRVR